MGGQSWLIGAEDAPAAALITEYPPNKSQKMQNSAVLAAPPSIRKALEKQTQSGSYSCAVPETEPRPVVAPLPPPVQDEQLQDLRQEFQAKLQAMSTQVDNTTVRLQAQVSQATASASEAQKVVQANISQHAEFQHNRIQALETKLEDVSKNLCTKQDMTALLAEIMARKTSEFRELMAKRSLEPSPVHVGMSRRHRRLRPECCRFPAVTSIFMVPPRRRMCVSGMDCLGAVCVAVGALLLAVMVTSVCILSARFRMQLLAGMSCIGEKAVLPSAEWRRSFLLIPVESCMVLNRVCSPKGSSQVSLCPPRLVHWKPYFHAQRGGEASHSGPGVPSSLHVRNVVSANTPMQELNTEPFDCTVWSETSATQFTLDSIRTKARLAKAYLATTTAAGSRMLKKGATVTGRGHAFGSLVYSKCKARSLHKLWPDAVFQSGRVSDALTTVGSFQLRVVGVYGYISSTTNADGLNEILFEEIFRQAASFVRLHPSHFQRSLPVTLTLTCSWAQLGSTTLS